MMNVARPGIEKEKKQRQIKIKYYLCGGYIIEKSAAIRVTGFLVVSNALVMMNERYSQWLRL